MTTALAILSLILLGLLVVLFLKTRKLEGQLDLKDAEITFAKAAADESRQQLEAQYQQESDRVRKHYEAEAARLQVAAQNEAQARIAEAERKAEEAIGEAQSASDRRRLELDAEADRIRDHYEAEARAARAAAETLVKETLARLEPLRKYEGLADAETQARNELATAIREASALRADAQALIESGRAAIKEERAQIIAKANEARNEADRLLDQAVRDAGRIVKEAEDQARQIGGDAYASLRDKETLDDAVKALWNVVDGYGDKYIIPTRSLLDDLAADFGHTEAGMALKSAREQSRRMVEQGLASDCNYVEEDRKQRAKRFVTDAFNGRVEAILSRVKHDNYGTLEQEIKDAFSLVNLNGLAFRDARVLPTYRDARLAELKWAVVVQELKLKAREEQRRIQE
jgi:vacuolar-type H+-ATPase subunit H